MDTDTHYNFDIDESGEKFNTDNWVNVKLNQKDGVFEYKVNDKLVHTKVNSNPQTWKNVKVVMGNRYANAAYTAAIGEYRNFRIITPSSKIFC